MGKRMAALALAVCMALPLFGCGGKLKAQSLTEGITARTIDTHTDLDGRQHRRHGLCRRPAAADGPSRRACCSRRYRCCTPWA